MITEEMFKVFDEHASKIQKKKMEILGNKSIEWAIISESLVSDDVSQVVDSTLGVRGKQWLVSTSSGVDDISYFNAIQVGLDFLSETNDVNFEF